MIIQNPGPWFELVILQVCAVYFAIAPQSGHVS
jgi:hypothetical protein